MAKQLPDLKLSQLINLSFGFFGVQIAYALQSANISRIFATLGADPHQLSFFWILPPLMDMIVQPIIGMLSDKTWCRFGRRIPYLFIGAIIAVLVMAMLPNAGSLGLTTQVVMWGLTGSMIFGLFSLMFLDTSINIAMLWIHDQYLLWVAYLLVGCGWAAMLAFPFIFFTNALQGNPKMGTYLGLFNCTICLPQIVAAVLGGSILGLVGSQVGMLAVAGALLIAGGLAVWTIKAK